MRHFLSQEAPALELYVHYGILAIVSSADTRMHSY